LRSSAVSGGSRGKLVPASSAWACDPAEFPVAINIGDDRARPGAVSARGVREFEFKLALAPEVLIMLLAGSADRFSLANAGRSGHRQ
jgi:hypothetical protein